jgi:hypothetical protein
MEPPIDCGPVPVILRGMTRAVALFLALAVVTTASASRAAGPLAPQGQPITTSAYSVDLFQGPVLAGTRITGLAGAYAPLAVGAEGMNFNAAAPAMRVPYSHDKVDWDVTAGVTFPSSVKGTDFDNNGTTGFAYDNFVFLTGGAQIQYGPWGVGVTLNLQQYDLDKSEHAATIPNLRLRLLTGHVLTAYSFLDDQLVLGAGVRGAVLGVLQSNAPDGTAGTNEKELLTMVGVAPEIGLVWAPKNMNVRFGMTTRAPVRGEAQVTSRVQPEANGDTRIDTLYLPNQIELPAELETGVAFQLGPRPLNLGWRDVGTVPKAQIDAERRIVKGQRETDDTVAWRILRRAYWQLPQSRFLITTSVLLSGKTRQAVGFESFLTQTVDRSGLTISASPRVGVEAEAVPRHLRLRGGSYLEPTRFSGSTARFHGTAGFDVKVLKWRVFNLFQDEETAFHIGGVIDFAREYFGWGISAGIWR